MASVQVCVTNDGGLPCFGPDPTSVTCPYCERQITTVVVSMAVPAIKWHHRLAFCLLCSLCCCCLAPTIHCVKPPHVTTQHTCPKCGKLLGTYVAVQVQANSEDNE